MKVINEIKVEYVPIDSVHPDPSNPRKMSDSAMESLERSLIEFGIVGAIKALPDGTIVGGNQTWAAAKRSGIELIPVTYLDLQPEKARLLSLALNRVSGTWDEKLLARLLSDLHVVPDVDLKLTGFDDDEINKLLKSLKSREKRDRPENFDLDAALERAASGRVTLGEVWQLGDHRLMYGDATDPAHLAAPLCDTRASMAFTDPPCNVALGDHGGRQKGQHRRRLQNDALSPEQWESFIRGSA